MERRFINLRILDGCKYIFYEGSLVLCRKIIVVACVVMFESITLMMKSVKKVFYAHEKLFRVKSYKSCGNGN
jgi:hypothetical protein